MTDIVFWRRILCVDNILHNLECSKEVVDESRILTHGMLTCVQIPEL